MKGEAGNWVGGYWSEEIQQTQTTHHQDNCITSQFRPVLPCVLCFGSSYCLPLSLSLALSLSSWSRVLVVSCFDYSLLQSLSSSLLVDQSNLFCHILVCGSDPIEPQTIVDKAHSFADGASCLVGVIVIRLVVHSFKNLQILWPHVKELPEYKEVEIRYLKFYLMLYISFVNTVSTVLVMGQFQWAISHFTPNFCPHAWGLASYAQNENFRSKQISFFYLNRTLNSYLCIILILITLHYELQLAHTMSKIEQENSIINKKKI